MSTVQHKLALSQDAFKCERLSHNRQQAYNIIEKMWIFIGL